jgi:hypothetical protein
MWFTVNAACCPSASYHGVLGSLTAEWVRMHGDASVDVSLQPDSARINGSAAVWCRLAIHTAGADCMVPFYFVTGCGCPW